VVDAAAVAAGPAAAMVAAARVDATSPDEMRPLA
jgi:hypothetical protein